MSVAGRMQNRKSLFIISIWNNYAQIYLSQKIDIRWFTPDSKIKIKTLTCQKLRKTVTLK